MRSQYFKLPLVLVLAIGLQAFSQSQSLAQVSTPNSIAPPTNDSDSADDEQEPDDDTSKKDSDKDDAELPAEGVTYSNPVATKWRMNAIIRGGSGPANNMLITMPIPTNWPEQSIAIIEEDIPANIANVSYRTLDSGVRQLVAKIPQIRPREEIKISVTFQASTSRVNPVANQTLFVRPKTNHRAGKPFLGVSPQINPRDSKLKKQIKQIVDGKSGIWEEVESLYDWVRDNIEDTSNDPQDTKQTFSEKKGCAEDKVGLFIAMCRAHKIPARMVWVEGAQYAEFMLVDSQANPHWFPCSVGGLREFGSVDEPQIILQKGDSIRVPEKKKRQKLVGEFATCQGTSKPSVRFHREILSPD